MASAQSAAQSASELASKLQGAAGSPAAAASAADTKRLTEEVAALSRRVEELATAKPAAPATAANNSAEAALNALERLPQTLREDVETIVHRYVVGDRTGRYDWANKNNGAVILKASPTYVVSVPPPFPLSQL